MIFCDSCYVAKYYLAEPDSVQVRVLVEQAGLRLISAWSAVEVQAALHRNLREGRVNLGAHQSLSAAFEDDLNAGRWRSVPITSSLLLRARRRIQALPADVFLRSGDALQLVSALEAGCDEIWSSDRHLLGAAPHFGLQGRSVGNAPTAASI